MKKKTPFLPSATYLIRVGHTPAARLTWALQKVNAYRTKVKIPWTPGDWENARYELSCFAFLNSGDVPKGLEGIMIDTKTGLPVSPSEDETRLILESFKSKLESIAQHKQVTLGPFRISQRFTWRANRYSAHEAADRPDWKDRTHYALGLLLRELGSRIVQCPARLPHSGKQCLTLFLKSKRGKYCSRKCASRETTRKFRDK